MEPQSTAWTVYCFDRVSVARLLDSNALIISKTSYLLKSNNERKIKRKENQLPSVSGLTKSTVTKVKIPNSLN